MFYVIGLGLSDEKDITLRGLEVRIPQSDKIHSKFKFTYLWQAIKSSTRVYLEAYTSILMIEKERLVGPYLPSLCHEAQASTSLFIFF